MSKRKASQQNKITPFEYFNWCEVNNICSEPKCPNQTHAEYAFCVEHVHGKDLKAPERTFKKKTEMEKQVQGVRFTS